MATIQQHPQISLETLVHNVEQLNTPDLDRFTNRVLALRAKRHAPSLPQREAELLQKINRGLPAAIQQRFDLLIAKRQNASLTSEEHVELLKLIEEVEQSDASRIEYLAELAQLRNVPIRLLMKQLGIHPPAYA